MRRFKKLTKRAKRIVLAFGILLLLTAVALALFDEYEAYKRNIAGEGTSLWPETESHTEDYEALIKESLHRLAKAQPVHQEDIYEGDGEKEGGTNHEEDIYEGDEEDGEARQDTTNPGQRRHTEMPKPRSKLPKAPAGASALYDNN